MTKQTRLLIAGTAAAVVQAGFFVGYYLITDGCLCATLDSDPAVSHFPTVVNFLNVVDLIGVFGIPGQVGDLPSVIERIVLNFLAWAMLLFIGLTGVSYLRKRSP